MAEQLGAVETTRRQLLADLAHDLCMFAALDVDMIGMGPYIPHARSAMPDDWPVPPVATRLDWTLRMIAVARLLLRDANIAATTALQTLDPQGRERALRCGANVMMPQTTPPGVRRHYQLYDGKPCLDDQPEACAACLVQRIAGAGRRIGREGGGRTGKGPEHEARGKQLSQDFHFFLPDPAIGYRGPRQVGTRPSVAIWRGTGSSPSDS